MKKLFIFLVLSILALSFGCAPTLQEKRITLLEAKVERLEKGMAKTAAAFYPASAFIGGGTGAVDAITGVAAGDVVFPKTEGDATYGNSLTAFVADDIGQEGSDGMPNTIDPDESSNMEWQRANEIYVYTELLPVGWMQDGTSAPGSIATHNMIAYRPGFTSGAATDKDLIFIWKVPAGLKEVTANSVKVRAIGLIENATGPTSGQGVTWQIDGCSIGQGDSVDCTLSGSPVDSTVADLYAANVDTQWDLAYFSWVELAVSNLAAAEYVYFKINRDPDDANDDYLQDIALVGMEVKYIAVDDTLY